MFSESRKSRRIKSFFLTLFYIIVLLGIIFGTLFIVSNTNPIAVLEKSFDWLFASKEPEKSVTPIDVTQFQGDWQAISKSIYGTTGYIIPDYNDEVVPKILINLESMQEKDMVNLEYAIDAIKIDLKNTSGKLWTFAPSGEKIFEIHPDYSTAVTRVGTAKKLKIASQILFEQGYILTIMEAYRTLTIQQSLREHFMITQNVNDKNFSGKFVAYPGKSNHQKGTAVDVTLVDAKTGRAVPMPTRYLEFSKFVGADANSYEEPFRSNILILQAAMVEAGMNIYSAEWWHFNDESLESKVDYINIRPDEYR